MAFRFPKIYPILDSSVIPHEGRAEFLRRLAESLAGAGLELMQYRNKTGSDAEILRDAAVLRTMLPVGKVKLILDDRVDLIDKNGFDGVHVDAGDASPREARERLGAHRMIGTFGGNLSLVLGVLSEPADYFSIGPIAPTTTKQTDKPLIGAEGVRRLREEAGPEPILVAAGGISFESAAAILAAGASSVAVSAAIFRATDPAAELRRWIERLS